MTATLLEILINSLWIGCLAAGFAWAGCALAGRDAAARHWICLGALTAMALLPTAQSLLAPLRLSAPAVAETAAPHAPMSRSRMDRSADPGTVELHIEPVSAWNPAAGAWIWALAAGALLLRVGLRARRALRLKQEAAPAPAALLARREAWKRLLGPGRTGALLESPRALSPFAVGWLRPAVALPRGLDRRLDEGDLSRLWLHEAAHLRRFDDWTALLAEILGAALFFHPAAWWLVRRIAEERELACDAMAAQAAGSAADYAMTLTRVAALRLPREAVGGLAFGGGPRLRRRIMMLLDPCRRGGSRGSLWAYGLSGAFLVGALAMGPRVILAQQEPAGVPAPPAPPATPAAPATPPGPATLPVQPAPPAQPAPRSPAAAPGPPVAPAAPAPHPVPHPPPLPAPRPAPAPRVSLDHAAIRAHVESMRPDVEKIQELTAAIQAVVRTDQQALAEKMRAVGEQLREQLEPLRRQAVELRLREAPSIEAREKMHAAIQEQAAAAAERVKALEARMREMEREMQPSQERIQQFEKTIRELERRLEEKRERLERREQSEPEAEPNAEQSHGPGGLERL